MCVTSEFLFAHMNLEYEGFVNESGGNSGQKCTSSPISRQGTCVFSVEEKYCAMILQLASASLKSKDLL